MLLLLTMQQIFLRHAQLTRISTELVDALNLYHQLMHEGQPMQQHPGYGIGNLSNQFKYHQCFSTLAFA